MKIIVISIVQVYSVYLRKINNNLRKYVETYRIYKVMVYYVFKICIFMNIFKRFDRLLKDR